MDKEKKLQELVVTYDCHESRRPFRLDSWGTPFVWAINSLGLIKESNPAGWAPDEIIDVVA